MKELEKQIDILIEETENKKLQHMMWGLTGDIREDEGAIQAFKLIKLLINTNVRIKRKGLNSNETVRKTQLIM